jgi:hypothetical protein
MNCIFGNRNLELERSDVILTLGSFGEMLMRGMRAGERGEDPSPKLSIPQTNIEISTSVKKTTSRVYAHVRYT